MESAAYSLTLIHCFSAEVLPCGFSVIDTNLMLTYASLSCLIYYFNASVINSNNIFLVRLEPALQLLSY